MAPKSTATKSTKRAATQVPTPDRKDKKAKLDQFMVGVVDALSKASDLSEDCRAMLVAGVPGCLGTPASDRHELQATMVAWIGQVMDGIEAKLQASIDSTDAETAEARAKKEDLDDKVATAQATLDSTAEAVSAMATKLAQSSRDAVSAKEKLVKSQEDQRKGDASQVELGKQKQVLQAAVDENVKYLTTEEGFQAVQAKTHMNTLKPMAKRLGLDESLLTALPSACVQLPSQRGTFDRMVVEQLEKGIRARMEELEGQLQAGAPASAERAAVVEAAQKEETAAGEAQKQASTELAQAEAELTAAKAAQTAAKAAVKEYAPELEQVTAARSERETALQGFKGYNVECFKMLRDAAPAAASAE